MATNISVLTGNSFGNGLVGLQFATDGGTPLFTIGNFQIDANLTGKQNKTFNVGEASEYYSLENLGETTPQDAELKINKTKLTLNPDYTNPKTYSYFGSIKEYFRVNVENIIKFWPASIYVDNVINTTTGNTVQGYSYNAVTNKSNFYVNNNFFVNNFDIKYVVQIDSTIGEENPLRNLNVEYSRYTIFYDNIEYPILNFTGSTSYTNDLVYFEVEGNPFPLTTGGTLSTKYHIKPNAVEVENFFSSLSDLSRQLLNRYIVPAYTIKFNYLSESDQGPFNIFVNRLYTWPVTDGYNLDIVSNLFDTYLTSLYEFCAYFDESDTNIMNRRLVAEAINRLNTIRRADGSEDENEAEKMSKLINIYAREFDEVKKYIDGLSYIRDVTYNKLENSPDSLIKSDANTLGWKLLAPMSDVDLISSFIPTKSVYSGYTINYSTYDAETEFWRRLIINTSHLWRSKGSRKAIEFLFEFIGAPEQLVSFNEHIYMAKKPLNVQIFKLILQELTGNDDITTYNLDEDGFPKILPNTPYTYYQSNGLWYRQTAGQNAGIDILDGNNPHIGPYDGGKNYLDQFRCLIGQFSATTIAIGSDYVTFGNLFKNYSNGLINDYNGQVYLNSYDLLGNPNICFAVTGTVTTDPDPQYVLNLCGCPIGVSDNALLISFDKKNSLKPCTKRSVGSTEFAVTGRTIGGIGLLTDRGRFAETSSQSTCQYSIKKTISDPPLIVFSSATENAAILVPVECCTTTNTNQSNVSWVDNGNGLGYCLWNYICGEIRLVGFTSQGYGIFYNNVNQQTGTTAFSIGVNQIDDCCKNFGGTIVTSTGIKGENQNYCQFKTTNNTVGVSSVNCPKADAVAITNNNVVVYSNTSETIPQECCSSQSLGFNVSWDGRQCVYNTKSACQLTILEDINGDIILFNDGTVHFTNGSSIVGATSECCNYYSTPELPLTFCGGNCYWIDPSTTCKDYNDIKVTLGVDGNDGVYLLSGSSENCYFQVEFDMLINFNCSEFLTCTQDLDILQTLSAFTINATIETATGTTPTTLQTYPAFNFNIENKPTGIYFSGKDSDCNALNNEILLELGDNCDIVTSETFSPTWVKVSFNINSNIVGQKIKLGFNFNNIPCNFDFLVDNIKIDRLCIVTNEDILDLTNCPGFDLERVIDNKKSWTYTEERINRSLNYLDFRETSYYENDSRLLINSKEIDLTLDAAKAIDNDVLCYAVKNDCFFYSQNCDLICPSGYTSYNGLCVKYEYTDKICTGTGCTIYTAATLPFSAWTTQFGRAGGVFYEDITTRPLPIYSITGGSITIASPVEDANNNLVNVVDIQLNNLWGGNPLQYYYNRLNSVGIWTTEYDAGPELEWIGFLTCVEIPTTKTYVIGMGADDSIRLSINNQLTIDYSNGDLGWNAWRMFPITLSAGTNSFKIEGLQAQFFSPALFGLEIYDASVATLTGITTTSALTPYIIFSTVDLDGQEFNVGEHSGYSCPNGYTLDCSGNCVTMITTGGTEICTGTTTPDPYLAQYQSEIDKIDDVNEFRDFVLSRLVDPKSRQVIRSYPLLRYMFDKYLNLCGNNTCDDLGNQYNYDSLNNFIKLIGDYWIELVEQLVPSTSIWRGATRYYRNTVFDQPKYKYKNYSLLTCDPVCTQLISGGSYCLLTLTEKLLYDLQEPVNDLTSPDYYLSEITDCWFNLFNPTTGTIGGTINPIPYQISELIASSGNTLNYASVTINGSISGNTIFSELLVSGTTIAGLSGVTDTGIINIITSSFSGSGYTITTDSNGIYITSPTEDDCGKTLNVNYCLNLSLSGVSGTTSAFNYPNIIDTPITIGGVMSDMTRNPINNSLYVLNDSVNGAVTVVDSSTDTITTTINLVGGQNPQRIAYNSANDRMYVLAYSVSNTGLVFVIDCTTNTVITTISLTFNPNYCDIVYASVNNRVYVSDFINNKIIAIDCNTNTIISTFPSAVIPGFSYPGRMGYNPINNSVYCATIGSGIFIINCATNVINPTPVPVVADYITYDSVNNRMYLSNYSIGTGRYINCNTNLVSTATTIGFQPSAIEYCSPYNVLYVSNIGSGDLRIVNGDTLSTLQNLVGATGNIFGIVYNPVNNKLYLANQETGNISVISAPTVSAVVSTNCQTCVPLLSSTFQTITTGTTTLVCGTNECGYTGYKDSDIEVIIEPIEIIIGTGSTKNSCVEVNNQTICTKIFINDINDDVTFGGRILNIKQ